MLPIQSFTIIGPEETIEPNPVMQYRCYRARARARTNRGESLREVQSRGCAWFGNKDSDSRSGMKILQHSRLCCEIGYEIKRIHAPLLTLAAI